MNLSAPFIRRPIATTLLTIGLALAGITAFFSLPVAPLPQVDFPVISVSASLAGASPDVMAQSVATPLERRLSTIAGVNEMSSTSSLGSTNISLQFDLSQNIDTAAREVQAAISASRVDLPATLRQNPTYRKVNPANQPVVTLALTSETRTAGQIYDAVSNIIQQRISQIAGVGDVTLGGGSLPAVRVAVQPYALNSYGIAMEDVRAAIEASNANRPKGLLENPDGRSWQIYTNAAGRVAADYRPLVVAWRNGAAVRLGDIAAVTDGVADTRTIGLFNGQRAIIVNITQQPGANLIEMVNRIRAELPALRAQMPPDIKLDVAVDRTNSIRASLREIEITVLISLILVIIVVFAFLRDLRSTFIPAVATVVSLLGTFGIMYFLGFSLNNLSLMAITVATGFVVDDAIVVLENTTRHLEEGMGRFDAALKGASEVGFTVLAMSIGLVAVFIPLLFMGGVVGRLFSQFAVTLSASVMISLVLSLTTTPMLCAWFLDPRGKAEKERAGRKPGRVSRILEAGYVRVERTYAASLDWALAMKPFVLLLLFAVMGLTAYLYIVVPKGFFPQQDSPMLTAGIRSDQSVSFQAMQKKLSQVVGIIHADPAVSDVVGFTGGRGGGAFMTVVLKSVGERHGMTGRMVIARLQKSLQPVAGIRLFLQPVQDLRIGARQSNSAYQYTLVADSTAALKIWSQKLVAALQDQRQLRNVDSDFAENGVESLVTVDRDTASRIGISSADVDNALYDSFGQRSVANIYEDVNQYSVILGWPDVDAGGPQALPDVRVPAHADAPIATGPNATVFNTGVSITGAAAAGSTTATGTAGTAAVPTNPALRSPSTGSALSNAPRAMVPLNAIASLTQAATAASVNHDGTEVSTTLSFDLAPGVALSDAQQVVAATEAQIAMPTTVHGHFSGQAATFQQNQGQQPLLILAAVIAVYIVLGILYESLIHPLTVISTLPGAAVGAVLALMAFGMDFSIIALIGLFLLLGLVKKNAILIIDFAINAQRTRGISAEEAAREASLLRFRPIMMTTLAAGFGALPLAIGFGEGYELRQPLGIAIIGGLLASQMLTLITTPVVYIYLDRLAQRRRRPRRAALRELPA